jgi:hypothetical protein
MDTTDGDTPERRTISLFDVEATKRVEAELDAFINKRSREREEANRTEELWAEQERRHRQRWREANRRAWREYERHLERVHMDLALDHHAKTDALAGSKLEPP